MKFLIDAQLPRRLIAQLGKAGLEAIHTLDLPQGNRTPDSVINERSITEQYVVVTKDSDFVESFLLRRQPWKLLLISTGNIRNVDLEALVLANMASIVDGFDTFDFIEVNQLNVIFHL